MKYLTDENVPNLVAELLRRAGIDVLTVHECGLQGHPDEEVLLYAGREGRCVITSDRKDYPAITRQFARQALYHSGIVCATWSMRTHDAAFVVEQILAYERQFPEGTPPYYVHYISKRSFNS